MTFCIEAECLKEFSFVVLNRWGEEVFKTNNTDAGWDGKVNGRELNTGVYTYILTFVTETGEHKVITGNISLIR